MRLISTALLLLLVAGGLAGQTPGALSTLANAATPAPGDGVQTRGPQGILAGNNPWLLAGEMSLKPLVGEGSFSEQWLLSSAKVAYEVPIDGRVLGGMRVPVLANFADIAANLGEGTKADSLNAAVQTLITSSDGLNVGVYPYWPLAGASAPVRTTLFTIAAAKVNSFPVGDTKERLTLTTGRFGAGAELALGRVSAETKPLTLSLAGVFSTFSGTVYQKLFNTRRTHLWSGELTAILPLRTGAGFLFEGIAASSERPSFRLGLVLAGGGRPPTLPLPEARAGTPGDACAPRCTVEVHAAMDLTAEATVTVAQGGSAVAGAPSPCAIRTGGACSFPVEAGKPVTVTVTGAEVVMDGGGCAGSPCTVTPTTAVRITLSPRP